MKAYTLSSRLLFSIILMTTLSITAIIVGNNIPLFICIIILTGLVAALDVTHSLSPLKKLEKDLKSISNGKIPAERITAKRSREIISLIREFNRMTLALSDRERSWRETSRNYHKLQGDVVRLQFVSLHSENIFNSVTVGIFAITKGEIVSLTNSAFHRLLGVHTSLAGLPISRIPFIKEQKKWVEGLRKVLTKGVEITVPQIKVEEKILNLHLAPLYEKFGQGAEIDGVVTLIEDVTEKSVMEERLLQSERLATVGKLAAQVAHEIRNPLNSIGLNTEYIIDKICSKKDFKENELHTLLQAIRDQVNHLASVTDQYLQMTRSPQSQAKNTSLSSVFREIDILIRPQFSFKGVSLKLKIDPNLPDIHIDPSQIRQAILNLLTNALDVSSEGNMVFLEVRLNNNFIEIKVQDQGPGIPIETKDKIFTPFYTTKEEGVGLGLALTKQIIEAHNGEISCFTTNNKGTTFSIELPISSS